MKRKSREPRSLFHKIMSYLGLLVGSLLAFVLALAYLLAGEIYDYEDSAQITQLPPVDAIVCLAGGRGRVAAAGEIWYRYWEQAHLNPLNPVNPLNPISPVNPVHPTLNSANSANLATNSGHSIGSVNPVDHSEKSNSVPTLATLPTVKVPTLYFSGMGRQVNWGIVSKQLRRGVFQVIRPEDVIIEKESSNTDANARWFIQMAYERKWKRILLLTSTYHMKRARFIFERVLANPEYPISVETYSVHQEPFAPEQWRSEVNGIRVTLMEYVKWIYYKSMWKPL